MSPGRRVAYALLGVLLAQAACDDSAVDEGELTTIELSADPTTALVDDSITFHFQAAGHRLLGIALDYGDGATDSIYTAGAGTADGNVKHAYQLPGDFLVTAEAVELTGGTATASVSVEIGEPPGG